MARRDWVWPDWSGYGRTWRGSAGNSIRVANGFWRPRNGWARQVWACLGAAGRGRARPGQDMVPWQLDESCQGFSGPGWPTAEARHGDAGRDMARQDRTWFHWQFDKSCQWIAETRNGGLGCGMAWKGSAGCQSNGYKLFDWILVAKHAGTWRAGSRRCTSGHGVARCDASTTMLASPLVQECI